jgi:hypothetical protein
MQLKDQKLDSIHNTKSTNPFPSIIVSLSFFVGCGTIIAISPYLPIYGCGDYEPPTATQVRANIRAINIVQEAYYLKNNKFSSSIPEIAASFNSVKDFRISRIDINELIGISNYQYSIRVDRKFSVTYAQSRRPNFKNYLGITYIGVSPDNEKLAYIKRVETYCKEGLIKKDTQECINLSDAQQLKYSQMRSIMCEVNQTQPLANIMPTYQNGTVSCPQGTKQI